MLSKINLYVLFFVITTSALLMTNICLFTKETKENFSLISRQDLLKIDPDSIRKNPEFTPQPLFSKIKSLNF
jgi:hypothetical protein